jgi:TonB family protein
MKSRRALLSFTCALAMVSNSVAAIDGFGQDKQREKSPQAVERTVTIEQTGDGAATLGVRVQGPPEGAILRVQEGGFNGVWVSGMPQADQTFRFVSSEMSFDNKVVKDAPFSGEMVYESIQTLADGNRIINKSTTTIYRDSQGRTRREQAFNFFGPFGGGNNEHKTIQIFDPVSNANYTLDDHNRIAHKFRSFARFARPTFSFSATSSVGEMPKQINVSGGALQGSADKRVQPVYPAVAKAARAQGPVQVQITVDESGNVISAEAKDGHPLLREAAVDAAKQWHFKPTTLENKSVKVQGLLTFNFVLGDKNEEPAMKPTPTAGTIQAVAAGGSHQRIKIESRTESLGKQTIEGVEAEGTRIVETIPAGAVGNERPIEIIRERWYSPELQMVVLTKSVDPRAGETTMRLTNLVRSEPDASLFQVPSDYTINEGDNFKLIEEKMRGEMKMRKPNDQ